jgi:hypothetical protein
MNELLKGWQSELLDLKGSLCRPEPTPQVEVGQVWNRLNTESDFLISIIGGSFKTGEDWEESVTYQAKASGDYYTRTMSDFVEKFVRVSE